MRNKQSERETVKRRLITAGLAAALVVSMPVTSLALTQNGTTEQDQTSVANVATSSTDAAQTDTSTATTQSATEAKSTAKVKVKKAKAKKAKAKLSKGEKAIKTAKKYLGCPYVYGAAGPSSFDCSGFTMYVYGKQGVKLTHNAQAQYSSSKHVSKSNLKKGDLVFFGSSTGSITHVGMYIGNGKFIHAPNTGDVVSIDSLSSRSNYVGAGRVS